MEPKANKTSFISFPFLSQAFNFKDLIMAAALTGLAWIHRILFLFSNSDRDSPFSIFYQGDSLTFFLHSRAILNGNLYDSGIPFHPPGFPYFLSMVHYLVGAGPGEENVPHLFVKLILALVGSLPVGLIYLLAKPYLGRTISLLTSFLCIYHFGLYILAVAPVSESLYLTLFLLSLLLWSRCFNHPLTAPGAIPFTGKKTVVISLILGILLGLMALTRAEGVLIAVILIGTGIIGWITRLRNENKQGINRSDNGLIQKQKLLTMSFSYLLPWILIAAGWTLPVIPWAFRNAIQLNEFNKRHPQLSEPLPTLIPLTIYGPLNLALANNRHADGTFSRDILKHHDRTGSLRLTDPQNLKLLLHGDELAWKYIRNHPVEFTRLVFKKWGIFFESFKLGWTQWNRPGGLSGIRRPVDLFVPYSNTGMWRLIPLSILGLIFCLISQGGPRRWAILILLMTGAGLLVTGFFFGYVRQGILLIPLWFSLVATAFVFIVDWIGRLIRFKPVSLKSWNVSSHASLKPSKPFLVSLVIMAILLFAIEGWGAFSNRNYQARGLPIPGQQEINPDTFIHLHVINN